VTPSPGMPEARPPDHHAQVGVECPQCHFRQFVEVEFDKPELNPPLVAEIQMQLQAWMASHCPNHLTSTLGRVKN
jgi:hypothetical protein